MLTFLSHRTSSGSEDATFDPTFRYETSWNFSPTVLFALRAFLSLYAFTTLFIIFGYNGTHDLSENSERSFSYFTHLTYWGLAFYTLFAAMHTCSYAFTGTPFLARWPRSLQRAHSVFYTTIVVYPWIVTIVYWALLYSSFDLPYTTWTNVSQHGLNSAYSLFEIVFPRSPAPPFLHMIPIVIILGLYLALAYLTHATAGFYTYDFLDLEKNSSGVVAGYCIGILVGSIILFLIVRYLIVLRIWVTEKKLGKNGKFSRRIDMATATDDMEKGLR